ncbi:conjugal transfer protein [Zhouia spongiae]|uniref:Conjugal transfer protein n=1 Tax=Zhouia spongiae TaxID=2202721 RepID=A0ABY3YLG2_9FLAO|nr:conjugal transfer protein [Zhouia spongiae]UNY98331.1 conjugal transfer protein [Zhouia spongiae]
MKTKIRRSLLLLFLMLLIAGDTSAQGLPVYDNTNFISLAKQLIESAKQTSQLIKTVDFLKQQKERIEKVNNAIKQLRAVQEIVQNNQQLYELVRTDLKEILSSQYIRAKEIDQVSMAFNSIIITSLEELSFMQQLLKSNYLEMTDAERLSLLEAQKMRSREMVAEIKLKRKRYQSIIAFRKLQDQVNNRANNYE